MNRNMNMNNGELFKSVEFYRVKRTKRTKWPYPVGVSFILEISEKV